jgi:hypothetical protein
MQMIGTKRSVVKWAQFSPMKLQSWLIDHMVANLWVASECSKRRLGLMVLLISTSRGLWPRAIPRMKTKISLTPIHPLLD